MSDGPACIDRRQAIELPLLASRSATAQTARLEETATMRPIVLIAAAALAAAPTWLAAQDKNAPPPTPPVFQAVVDCAAISDGAERLACFDRTVAGMAAAARERQLVVADRATMREARRGIFGLGLPKLKLFSGEESEEVQSIDSTITGVRIASDRMPIFLLADGSRWKQTEGRNVFARSGQAIHVRRAAMGSYMANVAKQSAVRVVRIAN